MRDIDKQRMRKTAAGLRDEGLSILVKDCQFGVSPVNYSEEKFNLRQRQIQKRF